MVRLRVEEVIGQRIRDARKRHEISQQELGRRIGGLLERGWPRQAVSAAETGHRAFTAAELVAISIVLDVSVGLLLTPPSEIEAVNLPGGAKIRRSELVAAALPTAGHGEAWSAADATIGRIAAALTQVVANVESLQSEVRLLGDLTIAALNA